MNLEDRIRRLEQENRRIRIVGITLAMISCGVVLVGLGPSTPTVVEARKFVLKDSAGHDRAVISITEDEKNTHFKLIDSAGNEHFFVGSGPSGALIWMTDGAGKLRISASASQEPSIVMNDKTAFPMLSLKIPEAGHAVIGLGEILQLIGSKRNGSLTIYGSDGFPRGEFSLIEGSQSAFVQIINPDGKTIASLPAIR